MKHNPPNDLETRTRNYLKALAIIQQNPIPGIPASNCPRCGAAKMRPNCIENSLSKYEPIYICTDCGIDETLRSLSGRPLPLCEWDAAKQADPHHDWTVQEIDVQDVQIADVEGHDNGTTIEAYVGIWFDAEEKFDLSFESDDDAINLYAYYDLATGTLTMQYILCLGNGNDVGPIPYIPTDRESALITALMEVACQKECKCSMRELVEAVQKEE